MAKALLSLIVELHHEVRQVRHHRAPEPARPRGEVDELLVLRPFELGGEDGFLYAFSVSVSVGIGDKVGRLARRLDKGYGYDVGRVGMRTLKYAGTCSKSSHGSGTHSMKVCFCDLMLRTVS